MHDYLPPYFFTCKVVRRSIRSGRYQETGNPATGSLLVFCIVEVQYTSTNTKEGKCDKVTFHPLENDKKHFELNNHSNNQPPSENHLNSLKVSKKIIENKMKQTWLCIIQNKIIISVFSFLFAAFFGIIFFTQVNKYSRLQLKSINVCMRSM